MKIIIFKFVREFIPRILNGDFFFQVRSKERKTFVIHLSLSYKFDYRSERLPRSFSLAKTENFRRTVDWFSGGISLNFHD